MFYDRVHLHASENSWCSMTGAVCQPRDFTACRKTQFSAEKANNLCENNSHYFDFFRDRLASHKVVWLYVSTLAIIVSQRLFVGMKLHL